MNARKKTEKLNAGVKEQLKAISQVTTRGADFQAVLKFTKFRAAHWEALWKEYTKPQWARLHSNLECGKQRAFANFSIS